MEEGVILLLRQQELAGSERTLIPSRERARSAGEESGRESSRWQFSESSLGACILPLPLSPAAFPFPLPSFEHSKSDYKARSWNEKQKRGRHH